MIGPLDLERLAEGIAAFVAGSREVRIFLQGDGQNEAYRDGWTWPDGLRGARDIRDAVDAQGVVLAWEGGACAFIPGSDLAPGLAPAPGAAGRATCPGVGRLPDVLATPLPGHAEIPDDAPLHLLHPDGAASGHARLAWQRILGNLSPGILQHPWLRKGVVLRRRGPLIAAFEADAPWPLAMRRIDR